LVGDAAIFEFRGNNIHESIFLQAAVILIIARILIGFGGGIISFTVISQLHTLVGLCFASRIHV
jgi:CRISPR/Cas system CSM-associated protein Csm5 (group 7 of RAMP superfamily)